jgi:hypothetical protein
MNYNYKIEKRPDKSILSCLEQTDEMLEKKIKGIDDNLFIIEELLSKNVFYKKTFKSILAVMTVFLALASLLSSNIILFLMIIPSFVFYFKVTEQITSEIKSLNSCHKKLTKEKNEFVEKKEEIDYTRREEEKTNINLIVKPNINGLSSPHLPKIRILSRKRKNSSLL